MYVRSILIPETICTALLKMIFFLVLFLFVQIDTLLACGGLAKNRLFVQEHADITGLLISLSHSLFMMFINEE